MATYRIFKFDARDGHALGAPVIVESEKDDDVIEKARQYIDGALIEVWQGKRLVQRLQPKS
jgi:hypothetical protein